MKALLEIEVLLETEVTNLKKPGPVWGGCCANRGWRARWRCGGGYFVQLGVGSGRGGSFLFSEEEGLQRRGFIVG